MRLTTITMLLWLSFVRGAIAAEGEAIAGVGPTGPVEKWADGFLFTEGPVAGDDGELYFSDIVGQRVYRRDVEGKVDLLLQMSGMCNGLAISGSGKLIACQGGTGRIVAIDSGDGSVTPIVAQYNANPFNQPNDLFLDAKGGIYFTDPVFVSRSLPQGTMAVYYVAADGTARRCAEGLDLPNGIALSPDGATLYVAEMGSRKLLAYPVQEPGKLGAKRELIALPHGGDGITVDRQGNVYVTQPDSSSIAVVDPHGTLLGSLPFPERPANCTFGGKQGKTLIATARRGIYAVPMHVAGFPGNRLPQ
ncbi:MAG: SMP-30/gluconolactonase/LRE family protein [Pirellulaceae bacterium]|nr:SMP-30/gluconolactonase/LRE family protein [Pirellulaceae bacterium]